VALLQTWKTNRDVPNHFSIQTHSVFFFLSPESVSVARDLLAHERVSRYRHATDTNRELTNESLATDTNRELTNESLATDTNRELTNESLATLATDSSERTSLSLTSLTNAH